MQQIAPREACAAVRAEAVDETIETIPQTAALLTCDAVSMPEMLSMREAVYTVNASRSSFAGALSIRAAISFNSGDVAKRFFERYTHTHIHTKAKMLLHLPPTPQPYPDTAYNVGRIRNTTR